MSRQRCLFIITLALLGLLLGRPARAEMTKPQILWMDSSGETADSPYPWTGKWLWVRAPVAELQRPVFRFRINFPEQHQVRIIKRNKVRAETFQIPQRPTRTSLVADTISPESEILLEIKQGDEPSKKFRLSLRLHPKQTMLWTHQSCVSEGLHLRHQSLKEKPFLYLAGVCRRQGKKINVTLLWSEDAELGDTSLVDMNNNKVSLHLAESENEIPSLDHRNTAWMNFTLPLAEASRKTSLKTSRSPATEDGDVETFSLDWAPRAIRPTWDWRGHLGLAAYNYSEKSDDLQVSQVALTAGIETSHKIQNSRFDFSTRFTASVATLSSEVTSTANSLSNSPPLFYQGDASLGYQVPRAALLNSMPQLKFYFGAQVWGMAVPQNQYGVKLIAGPQLGVQISGERGPRRNQWLLQASLAPFSEKIIAVQAKSYKINFNGSYEFTDSMAQHPISVFGNLEWISMEFSDSKNEFQSFTPSLGVRVGF